MQIVIRKLASTIISLYGNMSLLKDVIHVFISFDSCLFKSLAIVHNKGKATNNQIFMFVGMQSSRGAL